MSWKDKLRPASFRGVPFKVAISERAGGRRTVDHEYPEQDEAFIEDLGRRFRTFTIEAHVVGDDYDVQRDALLDALEQEGAAELVHPFYGARVVVCDSYRVRDTLTEEGRVARFSLTFKESLADPRFPVATTDSAARVESEVDGVYGALEDAFTSVFSTDGMPQFVLDSAKTVLTDATTAMKKALGPVVAGTEAAAELKNELDKLVLDADVLVRDPFKVVGRFRDTLAVLFEAPALPSRKLEALLVAYGFKTENAPAETTSTRRQQADNREGMIAAVQQLTLVEAVRQAPLVEFESHDAALATRQQLLDRLDDQIEATTEDALFIELTSLRSQLVLAVPNETQPLARAVSVTLLSSQPSIVLAYDLYGHLDLEADLIARNRIRHPGFVPAGRALQVLSDE